MTATTTPTTTTPTTMPKIFEHQQFGNLRVITDANTGEPWFVAKDVAEALGYADTDKSIRMHCKHAKLFKPAKSAGLEIPSRGLTIIPQGDVYRLVARSKLPTAQRIEEWIFDEVVPSVVAKGMYATPATIDAMIADPDAAINMLKALKEERLAKAALEERNEILEATVAYTEAGRTLAERARDKALEARAKYEQRLKETEPKAALVDAAFARPRFDPEVHLLRLTDVTRKLDGLNTRVA